jgi:hypothetical protein
MPATVQPVIVTPSIPLLLAFYKALLGAVEISRVPCPRRRFPGPDAADLAAAGAAAAHGLGRPSRQRVTFVITKPLPPDSGGQVFTIMGGPSEAGAVHRRANQQQRGGAPAWPEKSVFLCLSRLLVRRWRFVRRVRCGGGSRR